MISRQGIVRATLGHAVTAPGLRSQRLRAEPHPLRTVPALLPCASRFFNAAVCLQLMRWTT